jgi:hypothetical protein
MKTRVIMILLVVINLCLINTAKTGKTEDQFKLEE